MTHFNTSKLSHLVSCPGHVGSYKKSLGSSLNLVLILNALVLIYITTNVSQILLCISCFAESSCASPISIPHNLFNLRFKSPHWNSHRNTIKVIIADSWRTDIYGRGIRILIELLKIKNTQISQFFVQFLFSFLIKQRITTDIWFITKNEFSTLAINQSVLTTSKFVIFT